MLKNADNAVERVNDKNEAIHRASPVHSQQEHIATGLALYKNIDFYRLYTGLALCIVKWGILAQG